MNARCAVTSICIATLLLVLCHLLVRFGYGDLYRIGASGFMPGVIVEMKLSGNNFEGFGDWRTPAVINIATWLLFWASMFFGIKVWNFVAGK